VSELGPILGTCAAEPPVKNVLDVGGVFDDTKAIICIACVEHAMARLDAGPHSDRSRALEDALRSFVTSVPTLIVVAEINRDALQVHFPSGIQPGVVEVGEASHCGGEVTGEADGSVEEIGEFGRLFIFGGVAFDL
jgi:hypothetical protein